MDLRNLRKSDFITSIVIIAFGLFIILMSLQMPMKASYGGVDSHWYVAPSLLPLFIGGALIVLGIVLSAVAIHDGGLEALKESIKNRTWKNINEKTIRVWIITFAFISFIYLFIPLIDFVVSIATFLFFISSVFYSDSPLVFKNLVRYFLIENIVLIILFASGIGRILIHMYPYTIDLLAILFLVGMNIYARKLMKSDGLSTGKITTVMWVSIITPMILCPIFRYALLTPLPNEGIIIDHMNLLYYSLKY